MMQSSIRSHHATVLSRKECGTAGMIKAKRKRARLPPPELSSSYNSTLSHVILAQHIVCPLPGIVSIAVNIVVNKIGNDWSIRVGVGFSVGGVLKCVVC